jgi:hypothetical protein
MGGFTENLARLTEEIIAGRVSRQELRHALTSDIATLKTDVEAMLTDYGKKRVETRARMQSEMAEFTSRLRHFTRELSEQVIEMRKGFQQSRTDMLGMMHSEIGGFISGLKNEGVEMPSHFEPDAMYESPVDDQDDLTQIPGIGIRRQALLYGAGIRTFAQLAQSAPDRILQILGKQTGKANVDNLISRAADRCR